MTVVENSSACPVHVSVVMATYNGEKFLEEQILSILSQTLQPAEFIVCDDNSTDGTIAILEKYRQKGHLRYYANEKQLGVVNNFKKGISLASSVNAIALADQDDTWCSGKLEKMVAELANIDDGITPAIIYSDLIVMNEDGSLLNQSFWNEMGHSAFKQSFTTLLLGNFVAGCTILMNPAMRKLCSSMPEDVIMHDVWLALIAYSFGKVHVYPEPLVRYRKHSNNVTYPVDYRKRSRYQRWAKTVKNVLSGRNDYLEGQFRLAGQFYEMYPDQLPAIHKKLIRRFLQLRGKPLLVKKVVVSLIVKSSWIFNYR